MKKRKLSSREESILLFLKKFDFVTRNQLSRYFKLGSKRNTNRVISALSDYLSHVREGHNFIYYLNANGRSYVDCNKIRKKGAHVEHTIMRNEFYLFYRCPHDWRNEIKISDGKTFIIVDAMFSRNGFQHFLEVDNLQSMQENRAKITRYKTLLESLVKQYSYHPTLVWLTTTEHRRKQLEKECEGLKVKLYTTGDIK